MGTIVGSAVDVRAGGCVGIEVAVAVAIGDGVSITVGVAVTGAVGVAETDSGVNVGGLLADVGSSFSGPEHAATARATRSPRRTSRRCGRGAERRKAMYEVLPVQLSGVGPVTALLSVRIGLSDSRYRERHSRAGRGSTPHPPVGLPRL